MSPETAQWTLRALTEIGAEASPILNFGSSTGHFRTVLKPHIESELFKPLEASGFDVTHSDIRDAPGVDLVGDALDPKFIEVLKSKGFRAVLCSNLLEHVTDPQQVASTCAEIVGPGGYVILTVPRSYPYHADPIDTLYRPSVEEVVELFPGAELITGKVVETVSVFEEERRKGMKSVLKYPFVASARMAAVWRPKRSLAQLHRLGWLFRKFKATCVVVRV